MKGYSFYHRETGAIHNKKFSTDAVSLLALNTPPGHIAIDGHHDHLSKRVDVATGEIIEYQPPAPSADHEWNAETKRWQPTAAAADLASKRTSAAARIRSLEASQNRAVREHLLGAPAAAARLKAIDAEITSLRVVCYLTRKP
jgi:hypothetical protein